MDWYLDVIISAIGFYCWPQSHTFLSFDTSLLHFLLTSHVSPTQCGNDPIESFLFSVAFIILVRIRFYLFLIFPLFVIFVHSLFI